MLKSNGSGACRSTRAPQAVATAIVASTTARADVHWADLTALATERDQLLPPGGPDWPVTASHPPIGWLRLADREHMEWTDWRQAYLDKFAELDYARRSANQVAEEDRPS
jgi:hypothetical protein